MSSDSTDLLRGGGEMGTLMRSIDWSKTAVGPMESWPQSLRTALSMLMNTGFPMYIAWGSRFTQFYNDGYRPILGSVKHPAAMGSDAIETFPEIWHQLGPMFRDVMDGSTVTVVDFLFLLDRHGFIEECYFNFSYSPIREEAGNIGGVLVICSETTDRVIGARRLALLQQLGGKTQHAATDTAACEIAADVLGEATADVPFAWLYLAEKSAQVARLVATSVVRAGGPANPSEVDLRPTSGPSALPIARVLATRQAELIEPLDVALPDEAPAPRRAYAIPILTPGADRASGVLIVGLSPRLAFDDKYRSFLELVAGQLGTAIASARALEEAKARAEALAEIDRTKTAFFSNVSHEFRTPLTLLLGPTEDALAARETLSTAEFERWSLVHRNALRLAKLVNTLLDFSRVEAGRVEAVYEPADLAALTSDLASAFRSAIERGGVRFEVDCPPLPEPVFVDLEMWEKVILNLLSNAFKFTSTGTIRIAQRMVGDHVVIEVQDTGVGIPEHEMPRLFERFHRVEGTKARTQEGSGIGLALVQDLVQLHGGTIEAHSELGTGTTFRIMLPRGCAHLPASNVVKDARPHDAENVAKPFVVEALRWLRSNPASPPSLPDKSATRVHILIVDDNADMREYLARLLGQYWSVDAVPDGEVGLAAVRQRRPDLVIADLMMPNMDGIGLLRALRADDATKELPVIALSARAGDEARVEGLRAGFDDYLVKPFSARELVARVEAQVARVEVRAVAELHSRRLANVFENAPVGIAILRGPEHCFEFVNASYAALVEDRSVVGKTIREAFPDLVGQGVYEMLDGVFTTGEPFIARSRRLMLVRQDDGVSEERFFDWVYQPMRDDAGDVDGIVVVVFEVTELATARREAESANRAKDEFMAILGHELRNPLAPILTAVSLMQLRGDATVEKERSVIERQANHLVRLVDDLLDVSRITTGKVELKKQRVEVAEVVAKALEMASPMLEQRQQQLTIDVPPRGLAIDGDQARLAQVFSNLLTNAAKYTEPGGRVIVSASREDTRVVVRVRDTGIGISAEMLPRVFDLFSQEPQALDRAHGGLGLGLSIVKSLVSMHGGHVQASSEGHGRGSEFMVVLPAAAARSEDSAGTPPTNRNTEKMSGQTRVLVVDDNVDAADLLAELLVLLGYTTRVAHDGPTALIVADDFKPEIALLDIGLPAMDGYELARLLRGRPDLSDISLVAVTGYGLEADRRNAADAGFNAHLVKPVDVEKLRFLLRKVAPTKSA